MNWEEVIFFLLKNWEILLKPVLEALHIPEFISEFTKNFYKGVNNMEGRNLYLQKAHVETKSQIKELYDTAVAKNYKFYRAISAKGKYYGWDEYTNSNYMLNPGVLWAENPHYVETEKEPTYVTPDDAIEPADEFTKTIERPVKAEQANIDKDITAAQVAAVEAKTEAVKTKVEKTVPLVKEAATDYKTLYERLEVKCKEQEQIALQATEKMLKYKNALKKAADIMIEAIGE